jgi:hypothetical protein
MNLIAVLEIPNLTKLIEYFYFPEDVFAFYSSFSQ